MDAQPTAAETQNPPHAPAAASAPKLQGRPPLVITFGFSGHREYENETAVAKKMDAALATIQQALKLLLAMPLKGAEETLGAAYDETARLRLLTGDAPGADGLMIRRWSLGEVGAVHRLYPYRDPT